MKYLIFTGLLAVSLALFLALPARAQVLDSYHFLADDGVQDEEEMEQEAMYVFGLCDSNIYQKAYFDCECVAGAFLQEREEVGSIVPQSEIIRRIYREGLGSCANTIEMAGEMYQSCQGYASTFREYAPDNEEFCTCVANTFAESFTRNPFLRTKYIESLRTRALVDCENRDPQGRPVRVN